MNVVAKHLGSPPCSPMEQPTQQDSLTEDEIASVADGDHSYSQTMGAVLALGIGKVTAQNAFLVCLVPDFVNASARSSAEILVQEMADLAERAGAVEVV